MTSYRVVYHDNANDHDYLEHHGIHGQKWGIRRFQNPDGTLTEAGKKRYRTTSSSADDINDPEGLKNREKDVRKSIRQNEKARGKEHSKIANNPENFLGLNKRHANKIDKYTKNIDAGKAEIERILAKVNHKKSETEEGQENERLLKQLKNSETISKITEEDSKKLQALLDKSYEVVDWYNGWAKDPADTQRLKELKRLESGHRGPMTDEEYKKYKKVKNQILSSVLNGIGIKDTEENRRLIENQVFWD